MSTRIDARIANANAAPSCAVKVAVWVMKPGPMALVAIRNIAPSTALRREAELIAVTALVSLIGGSLQKWVTRGTSPPVGWERRDRSTIQQYFKAIFL